MPIFLAWKVRQASSILRHQSYDRRASKSKTDVFNAKMLILHDLTGIWPESYLPSADVKELQVLIQECNRFIQDAYIAGNHINNIIVRFGLTIGREGSVVKKRQLIRHRRPDFFIAF